LGRRPSRGKPYKRSNNGSQQGFEILHNNSSSGRDLVEKLGHIRKYERNENEHGNYRKYDLVNEASPRQCAHFTRLAGFRWPKNPPSCKEQSDKSPSDKKRTIWFEQGEISDPRSAQTESNQNQWAQAAGRGQEGGQTSHKKRA